MVESSEVTEEGSVVLVGEERVVTLDGVGVVTVGEVFFLDDEVTEPSLGELESVGLGVKKIDGGLGGFSAKNGEIHKSKNYANLLIKIHMCGL